MLRIPMDELRRRIAALLESVGMDPAAASLSAKLTAETDGDGVRTHGVARLPRFVQMVLMGEIDINSRANVVASTGALERWTGNRGPGNLAAYAAMERACDLANEHGVGCVALSNTTHWMRGGTYGWQAADRNCAALCWTNTMPNLPPWGSAQPVLGNNPLVLAVPRSSGEHIVLDFAMSQFSYGALASYAQRGEQLPVPGGFDAEGNLTTDAAAIELAQRALPIGFWKGSGLSFVLDVLAAALSGGNLTGDISRDPLRETGLSQVFLAIAPLALGTFEELNQITSRAIASLHGAGAIDSASPPRYPGESVLRTRIRSRENGVLLEDAAYGAFLELESRHGTTPTG